jgi:hypothetical protein
MKMKNKFLKLFVAVGIFTIASCETTELDLLVDPNTPSPDLLDPNFVFNNVQLSLPGYVNAINGFTRQVTRQTAMTGGTTYNNAYQEVSFNGIWGGGYGILNDIKAMEPKAEELGLNYHLGASKVIKAYVWSSLADVFGDIPYSEALQGNANLAPKFDNSADVYKGALTELDEAIVLLSQTALIYPKQDLYYGVGGAVNASTQAKWLTVAKTLKLKLLNNARLNGTAIDVNIATEMTALLNENNLIDTEEEDFSFKYGNSRNLPNSRHPNYNTTYENATTIGGSYLGNYFMWTVVGEKAVADPRRPFYFFRQDTNTVGENIFTLGCAFQSRPSHFNSATFASFYQPAVLAPFCTATTSGYWGRDHGDASGLPPDNAKRTVPGVYPVGGKYDEGVQESVQTNGVAGFLGAGVMPIIMSSWVDFIKAEAVLTLGVSGDARALLESGMRKSINNVINFKGGLPLPTSSTIDTYVNYVLTAYDASTDARKLEIVMKEYYVAAWGNGLEPYNNYRRTGYPSNMQPTLNPSTTDYFYTALYPADSTVNNPNSPANSRTKRVFWDPGNLVLN